MNATLQLLLDGTLTGPEIETIRLVASRVGLLWHCEVCRRDNAGGRRCGTCDAEPPAFAPKPASLSVVPVVSAFTGIAVTVCDDENEAQLIVDRINQRCDAPVVELGAEMPHNPRRDDTSALDYMADRATGKA